MKHLAVKGLNHLIRSESWAVERLRSHAGARLQVDGGPLSIQLLIDEHGLLDAADTPGTPDVTLTLPADAVASVLFAREKMFAAVKLGGSAEIAESLAFVFRNLKWDAEADLAQVVGDIAAHRLALIGRAVAKGLQDSLRKAAENIREYAVEDSPLLTPERDRHAFAEAVNRLHDDVAQLEKRISRL